MVAGMSELHLIEFLRARLDEDELNARQSQALWRDTHFTVAPGSLVIMDYLRRRHPSTVLADIDAKRRILDEYQGLRAAASNYAKIGDEDMAFVGRHMYAGVLGALKCLALPYADHPDYRDEWRP
jgi:hypothetical protein